MSETLVVRQQIYESGEPEMILAGHAMSFERTYWLPMSQHPIQGCGKNVFFNNTQLTVNKLASLVDCWLAKAFVSSPVIVGYRDSLWRDST